MNNNDKPERLWAQRLFKQSSLPKPGFYSKAYFGHRFHNNQTTHGHIPFSAFFAESDKQQLYKSSDFTDLQGISGREFALPEEKLSVAETGLNDGLNSNTLSSQFTVLNCYDETLDTKTFRLMIVPLFLRKIFPGVLLEKSAKITRQPLPAAAPAVLLLSFYTRQGV